MEILIAGIPVRSMGLNKISLSSGTSSEGLECHKVFYNNAKTTLEKIEGELGDTQEKETHSRAEKLSLKNYLFRKFEKVFEQFDDPLQPDDTFQPINTLHLFYDKKEEDEAPPYLFNVIKKPELKSKTIMKFYLRGRPYLIVKNLICYLEENGFNPEKKLSIYGEIENKNSLNALLRTTQGTMSGLFKKGKLTGPIFEIKENMYRLLMKYTKGSW